MNDKTIALVRKSGNIFLMLDYGSEEYIDSIEGVWKELVDDGNVERVDITNEDIDKLRSSTKYACETFQKLMA